MRIFGLIGYPLSHSFSKGFFATKFKEEGITDCTYENFPIASIDEFERLLQQEPALEGLNVTIPYKEQVIPFLNWKSKVVQETGACNCIKLLDGRLYGFNTDTTGFKESLKKKLLPHHDKALILGTGGAAKAVGYVLEQLKIDHSYVTSSKRGSPGRVYKYDEITGKMLQSHTLLINTTPLGMYPNVKAAPPIDYHLLSTRHYLFDLVYNPEKTIFLKKGEEMGASIQNGFDMLIIQAEESWKIWNKDPTD